MKSLLITLAFILLFPVLAFAAANVIFQWDANAESNLSFYRIYKSSTSGSYIYGKNTPENPTNHVETINAGTETITMQVEDGTWYWVLTAVNTALGESGPSNEVMAVIEVPITPPSPPTGLQNTVILIININ